MSDAATPIRRQYLDIKRRFPQAIVFFRLGDFYETFDDDAKLVARELEITLTSKPMGKDLRVPLAGVPHHSLQAHLKKLVAAATRWRSASRWSRPARSRPAARRIARARLVAREVMRVVTPGTVVEEELLSAGVNNYLAAVAPGAADEARTGVRRRHDGRVRGGRGVGRGPGGGAGAPAAGGGAGAGGRRPAGAVRGVS